MNELTLTWRDFSGAPPLLLPRRLVSHWHGAIDPVTGEYPGLNVTAPVTDYDRACAAAWPGRGILQVGSGRGLVLYSEFDLHAWLEAFQTLACGGTLPSADQLVAAQWTDPLTWQVDDEDLLLINAAACGSDLRSDDVIPVRMARGTYRVEYSDACADLVACFHRFTLLAANGDACITPHP